MEQYNSMAAGGYVQIGAADKSVTTELSADFTLPDYQPEIKRLLRVSASVLPASKYVGMTEAEFTGNIDYYVLYTGSDNQLYCAPLTSDYKVSVPYEIENGILLSDMTAAAEIVPELVSGRVTSPRKLNIKCRLRTHARIFGELPIEDGFDQAEGETQVLRGESQVSRLLWGSGDRLELSDEMLCDSRDGEIRVISAEGKVMPTEASASSGAVNCRGDLYLKLLLCHEEGGLPYTVMRKLPFTSSIPTSGVVPTDSVSVKGTVCEMNITVEEGRIGMDVGVLLESEAVHKETVSYVKDIYSTSRLTDCRYRWVLLPSAGNCFTGNFTLGDSKGLEEAGISADCRVIDAVGSIQPEEHRNEDGRCLILGKAKFSVLCEKEGDFTVNEVEFPFRYEAPAKDAVSAYSEAEAIYSRVRADGERIGIDAEICIRGGICGNESTRLLESADFGECYPISKGEIRICYPGDGDSIWSVAKRYGRAIDALTDVNGLTVKEALDDSEGLKSVRYLIL